MKELHLRIKNIDDEQYQELVEIAMQQTGKPHITSLVRKFLNDITASPSPRQPIKVKHSKRFEIRINKENQEILQARAEKEAMSINSYISLILHQQVINEPIMTHAEVDVLRNSNYQLYKIGMNLNQIARALNSGNPASFTTQDISSLQETVKQHIDHVAKLIRKAKRKSP